MLIFYTLNFDSLGQYVSRFPFRLINSSLDMAIIPFASFFLVLINADGIMLRFFPVKSTLTCDP